MCLWWSVQQWWRALSIISDGAGRVFVRASKGVLLESRPSSCETENVLTWQENHHRCCYTVPEVSPLVSVCRHSLRFVSRHTIKRHLVSTVCNTSRNSLTLWAAVLKKRNTVHIVEYEVYFSIDHFKFPFTAYHRIPLYSLLFNVMMTSLYLVF